jgi:hypothetical protein
VDTQVNRHTGRSADCAGAALGASSWVSGNEPGRPDGETEMTTMSTPYATTAPSYSTSDDDTVRLPLVTTDPRPAEYRALDHRALETRPADHRPVLDATRLWTGGLATAAVAALVALVGTLVIRVLVEYAPVGTSTAHAIAGGNAGLLCLFAALAALAATGVAHLLIVSTPDPLSYLGWIIGLSTAAAVVVPLLGGLPTAAAVAIAIVNLVIGLAIGSLIVGAAAAAYRPAAR